MMKEFKDNELIIDFEQESIDIDELGFIIKDARFNGYKTARLSVNIVSSFKDDGNGSGSIEYFHTAKLIFTK